MLKRKSNKTSRTRQKQKKKEELRNKLKQKLHEKTLERTSRVVRDKRIEDIEEKLEESKNPTERLKLKEELALLEKVQEKEFGTFSGDFPDYGDGCSYGGSMERPD